MCILYARVVESEELDSLIKQRKMRHKWLNARVENNQKLRSKSDQMNAQKMVHTIEYSC